MLIVIFRASLRHVDEEYHAMARVLRELAFDEFGCLDFQSRTEQGEEISISWWPDEAAIMGWRQHPAHRLAQQRGKEHWYNSWSVEVAAVTRAYQYDPMDTSQSLDNVHYLTRP